MAVALLVDVPDGVLIIKEATNLQKNEVAVASPEAMIKLAGLITGRNGKPTPKAVAPKKEKRKYRRRLGKGRNAPRPGKTMVGYWGDVAENQKKVVNATNLSSDERIVMNMTFGVGKVGPLSARAIANRLAGLSAVKVSEIRKAAFAKLGIQRVSR
jgi:hypothetical protein